MFETYFKNLAYSIKDLMEDLLVPQSLIGNFFKKRNVVGLADLNQLDHDADIQVIPVLPYSWSNQTNDSTLIRFPKTGDPDTVLVFRAPVSATFRFIIACPKAELATKIDYIDKLSQYFFQNRSIDPFLPSSLKKYPQLFLELSRVRAQVKPVPPSENWGSIPGALFCFEYVALFHSGVPLREEKLVQKRTIEMLSGHQPN